MRQAPRKKLITKISLFLLLFLVLGAWNLALCEEQQIAAAIHVHSNLSSGRRTIAEIAKLAPEHGIDVVIMTDLLAERYEYGIWPFEKIIKKTMERDSLLKWGTDRYFKQIEEANRSGDVLVIDGVAVTPFYYWTGNVWPGPLYLNGRAKDFLVLGLGDPKAYDNLPVLSNGKSRFNAYEGDQYDRPYQEMIDHVNQVGGLIYWSHPHAHEEMKYKTPFGTEVRLNTSPYIENMRGTQDFTGIGVTSVELAQIDVPQFEGISSPEKLWDKMLMEYCKGLRKKPIWAVGEVDFSGPGGINDLSAIMNILLVKEKTRAEVLNSLARGKYYLTTEGQQSAPLVLYDFSILNPASGEKAGMGETLSVQGNPVIQFDVRGLSPDGTAPNVHWILLRNGRIWKESDAPLPFRFEIQDDVFNLPRKSYYRVIAYQPNGAALLSNPIFLVRQE